MSSDLFPELPRALRTLGSRPFGLSESGLVFSTADSPSLGLAGRAVELETEFDALPLGESWPTVALDGVASSLDLRTLRRFVHRAARLLEVGGTGHFVTLDPDRIVDACSDTSVWPGSRHEVDGLEAHYRPLRQIFELLRLFPTRPRTPIAIGDRAAPDYLWIRFEKTERETPLRGEDADAKYGDSSDYRAFDRLEEPEIFDDWCYAASRLRPAPGEVILSIGSNDGRELAMFDASTHRDARFIGIDAAASAIEAARERYPRPNFRFLCEDLARLGRLDLPEVDLVLALGVFQCTSVDREQLLRDLMPRLSPKARLLVSIPNCHFGSSDILRRPLDRSEKRHDRSLVHKDLRFLSRHFYRHGFTRIESFGTYDAFLLIRR